MTSAENPANVSLNLSALAETNMGSAIAELRESESLLKQAEAASASGSEGPPEEDVYSQLPPPSEGSMQEYYQLQQNLLKLTLVFTGVIFLCVWGAYSLNTALNYVIGACTGIVYFRMLGKSVSSIGREKPKPSSGRLAIFIGVMIVSTQWQQLSVLPVFLGFLTYKAALIAFVIWTAVMPSRETA
ncbi:MAG: ATP synthase subunit I [Cyanobacteria bacterium J06649_4]